MLPIPCRRRALTLTLLALLTGAGAIRVLPGSPLVPTPLTGTRTDMMREPTSWEPPTFELLVTVSALTELTRRGAGVLPAASAAGLGRILKRVGQQPRLTPDQASAALAEINRVLGASGGRQLHEARLRLEERAHLQLSSSRYARGEDFPAMSTFRLALLVPGGQATVQALGRDPELNPFGQGVPAVALDRLILALRR